MKIRYSQQDIPDELGQSIFLSGPTPRDDSVISWRPQAIEILETLNFTGTVIIPENEGGERKWNYDDQIEWEWVGLKAATCIVFWIPRELVHMPAFTTNIEWGRWYESGKVVLGYPENTPKMGYLTYCAEKYNIPVSHTLPDTLKSALEIIKK